MSAVTEEAFKAAVVEYVNTVNQKKALMAQMKPLNKALNEKKKETEGIVKRFLLSTQKTIIELPDELGTLKLKEREKIKKLNEKDTQELIHKYFTEREGDATTAERLCDYLYNDREAEIVYSLSLLKPKKRKTTSDNEEDED